LDEFIANLVGKPDKVETLWDAVYQLGTTGSGMVFDFAHDKAKTASEKSEMIRKYFKAQKIKDTKEAMGHLRGLNVSSGNRSFWHGQY